MPLNFVGLNASLTFPGDPNVLADHVRRMNGAFSVLCTVGDAKRALEYANAMPANTFIDRLVENGDGGWWITLTPQQMVDKYASREGRGTLVRYVLNEPGIAANPPEKSNADEPDKIRAFVQWCVDVLDKGAAIGERYVIGSLWAGTPNESWIDNGYFDPLIRALDRHYDRHFLGLHEGQPFLTAGKRAITLDYESMKNPVLMQESEWGDPATTSTDNAWMTGRCWRWGKRAIQIGCKPPKIILTEFTPAQNQHEGAQDLYRYLTGKYGVYRGRYLDGIPSLVNCYKGYYGDNWIAVTRNMLAWDAAFLPYNVVGLCPFTENFQDVWIEFNVGALPEWLEYMFANPVPMPTRTYTSQPTPPDPTPQPPKPRVRVNSRDGLNARATPNGTILGVLANGETCELLGDCTTAVGSKEVWVEASTRYGVAWLAARYLNAV